MKQQRQEHVIAPVGGCELCEGRPWVSVERTVFEFPRAYHDELRDLRGVAYRASGACRCDCAKGRWLRERDRENDARRAAGQPV